MNMPELLSEQHFTKNASTSCSVKQPKFAIWLSLVLCLSAHVAVLQFYFHKAHFLTTVCCQHSQIKCWFLSTHSQHHSLKLAYRDRVTQALITSHFDFYLVRLVAGTHLY